MTNPSSVSHRAPILVFILLGMGVAIYLGFFQLHVLSSVWDPIFHQGSVRVLKSPLSRSLPIPDSLLGAFGYFCEAIALSIGGQRRFETIPWIVILYSAIAFAMGAISLILIGYQALGLGSYCLLCLCSASLSLLLLFPAYREGVFALRIVRDRHKRGEPWRNSF